MQICDELVAQQKVLQSTAMRDLFTQDKERFKKLSLEAEGLLFDYSKQRVTPETITLLCNLANKSNLAVQREALFAGLPINQSENRAVLHTTWRMLHPSDDIKAVQDKMEIFSERVRRGQYQGATGKPILDIISLGIGGSDLGPLMTSEALRAYKNTNLKIHFVSNSDGRTLHQVLKNITPQNTLCIINSKTFTTPETLLNAHTVKEWFMGCFANESLSNKHFIGVTTHAQNAINFGILPENIFEFSAGVGGRYSIWSAVGLPLILYIGMPQFKEFLYGAHCMDKHFCEQPFEKNIAVLQGLLGIWNINYWGAKTQAIIPYDDGLQYFPAYLQQLEMESNGKSAQLDSKHSVQYDTAPVIWGGVGCNSQHAFMQLLHQGSQVIPVDFIIPVQNSVLDKQQKLLVASCLSQSKALMEGRQDDIQGDSLALAKFCPGNRPSTTIMFPKLNPQVLGSLLALYEHKVFVQGVIWNINSFDQWGVELGKKLAKEFYPALLNKSIPTTIDSSSKGLLEYFYQHDLK